MNPEERARQDIDRYLTAAGWEVQDRADRLRQAILQKAF
jgi:type I site-specific restriction endonuclease